MTQGNPPPYVSPAPGSQQAKKGFPIWLIVLLGAFGFIVVIVGILGALAFHGFSKYMRAAKSAEAKEGVGRIARDAAAAYERERVSPDGTYSHALCASASSPVPADVSRIRGVKYMSSPSDWDADKAADAGFACLRFRMLDPQYYQYDYKATGSTGALDQFRAIARGDIDGDGNTSSFTLEGRVAPGDTIVIAPSFVETDPDE